MNGSIFDLGQIKTQERHICEAEIRSLCRGQYLGNNEVLCRCLGRYSFYLDSRDVGFAVHIMMDGFWEYWVTKFMIETVEPGFRVLDIGANFGYYSLLLSDLVGAEGYCHAIEPNPHVAKKLRKSLAVNGFTSRSHVLACALGRTSGYVSFFIPTEEPKNACVVESNFVAPPGADCHVEQIEVTSGDALWLDEPRLDFVKIDAEGSEFDILIGMTETLRRFKPKLLLEFNANRGYDGGLLLNFLREIYGNPRFLDYDAQLKEISEESLLDRRRLDDWMLYFESAHAG